ncbi:uncharacterized protein LOC126894197 [Daktulosphaira vitifoliae]|uniref:uncharacterized protein LOC126894197 n=1 Tax=Daktulosphaira vitifoliae TaxID=58002 RepID=UPI0021A99B11|nr:uncharacterized protein LOC126894197 [Daktulosphaira vitifoliae]
MANKIFSVICFFTLLGWVSGYDSNDNITKTLDINEMSRQSRQAIYPCQCKEGKCTCCSGNLLQNININLQQKLCAQISYDSEEFEFNVRLLFNDYTLFNRVVSGRNPRPLCVPIFPVWTRSRVCLKFSDIYFIGRNIHMCLGMETQTNQRPTFSVEFNCIRLGTEGVALLKPEEGGGLPPPAPEELATENTISSTITAKPNSTNTMKKKKEELQKVTLI